MLTNFKSKAGEVRIWFCNFVVAFVPSRTFRFWYYRRIMGFKIGKGVAIHLGCRFNSTRNLFIGDHTVINQHCHIDNRGVISIGRNVSISPKVSIVTADHDLDDPDFKGRTGNVDIHDYVFIGYDAKVFKNVSMSTGSVLGAMSLLTKSTEPYGIYMGIPARLIRYREKSLRYELAYRRFFH